MKLKRVVISNVVDEECRRAVDATPHAAERIRWYPLRPDVVYELLTHTRHIQLQERGLAEEMRVVQRLLVLEKQIVRLPEVVLRTGRFRHFGGVLCMRVAPAVSCHLHLSPS